MNDTYIDSEINWIGKIPESWKLIKIREILKERNEKNSPIKTTEILSLTASQGVIPLSEKISGGNKPKDDISNYKLAYPNDIVMNSMNVLSGSVSLSNYYGCVSPVYYMLNLRNSSKNNIKFVNFIFQTKAFQKSLLGLGNGIMMKKSSNGKLNTIRMRIPLEKIYKLYIPISNKKEQDKIVEFLEQKITSLDDIIKHTKITIEDYEKYKKALIIETVTEGLNKNVQFKESSIEWLNKIPAHWNETISKHILRKLNRDVKKDDEMLVCSNSGKVIKKIESKTGLETDDDNKLQGVKSGDLLIHGMDTWHGAIAVSELDGKCTSVVHVCDTKENKRYIMYYLQSLAYRNIYKKITNGVRENTSDFRSWERAGTIPIIIPPKDEQDEIAKFLDSKIKNIDNIIKEKQNLVNNVETYKNVLIYEYVTGKKQVK